jgi:hypothetical protein
MGMIPRAVEQVFRTAEELRAKGWEYTMEGQFLEIVCPLSPTCPCSRLTPAAVQRDGARPARHGRGPQARDQARRARDARDRCGRPAPALTHAGPRAARARAGPAQRRRDADERAVLALAQRVHAARRGHERAHGRALRREPEPRRPRGERAAERERRGRGPRAPARDAEHQPEPERAGRRDRRARREGRARREAHPVPQLEAHVPAAKLAQRELENARASPRGPEAGHPY